MGDTLRIPPDHPALPGHFPGQPVVPGVVLLSEVMGELRRQQPGVAISGIRRAKFLRRLLPGEGFSVEFGTPSGDSLRFRCRHQSVPIAEGYLLLQR